MSIFISNYIILLFVHSLVHHFRGSFFCLFVCFKVRVRNFSFVNPEAIKNTFAWSNMLRQFAPTALPGLV